MEETLHTVWQTPLVPSAADDHIPSTSNTNSNSSSRSVSSPFPMAANSATAALQKNQQQQQLRQQQHPQQQHPQLDTQPAASYSSPHGGGSQAPLRAPAVFRIPVAPFPFPPPLPHASLFQQQQQQRQPPIKQLGSLSLRDANDDVAAVESPQHGGQRVVRRPMLQTPTTVEGSSHNGVIGMGFASSSSGSAFLGSGLLEGGAPLVKRGTTNRNVSPLPRAVMHMTSRDPIPAGWMDRWMANRSVGHPLLFSQASLPSSSAGTSSSGLAIHQRSPLTPATTVSVTTSNNIPPPPFGSGIPGQPGSGVPTSAQAGSRDEYLSHGFTQTQTQPAPVKRHHLKNWTEAEPNRLVARSKARPGKGGGGGGGGGDKASKDEARTQPSSSSASTTPATTSATKSGTYPAGLGRRASPALLDVPTTASSDLRAQARAFSTSSCASGAEADTEQEQERDTSLVDFDLNLDESADSAVKSVPTAGGYGTIFVPAASSLKVVGGAGEVGPPGEEVKRKQSPSVPPATRKRDGGEHQKPQQDSARGRIPCNAIQDKRSVSPVALAHAGIPGSGKSTAVPEVAQSVQGYDGGNVGVLGGGVKLGGGGGGGGGGGAGGGVSVSGSISAPTTAMGKQDHTSRSVSGQSSGRAAAKMRSTSGSSAFGGGVTGSESETTIGSGTEGGKGVPGSGHKKRRGRPQQSRSPNIPHSHSHAQSNDPNPAPHNMHNHQWSPVIPTHMHHPPATGGMPGMLGAGIAGQPGSIGFPPGSTLAHGGAGWQGYASIVPPWAPRPTDGISMPGSRSSIGPLAHSPPYVFASSSAGKNAATTSTSTSTRPIMGPALPSLPTGQSEYPSQAQQWTS
ncbi:hypothetical protein QFC24_003642 [Naganishia onofrii]|uniref:Uncharacterized protein n=1 Tax=Naganishia onofrii TaxID=1851511 RepID=A0ACC2XIJ0_9TREE|nr:hypothetical protein QFC24_003642 [Naganishia onofrii]